MSLLQRLGLTKQNGAERGHYASVESHDDDATSKEGPVSTTEDRLRGLVLSHERLKRRFWIVTVSYALIFAVLLAALWSSRSEADDTMIPSPIPSSKICFILPIQQT